MNRYCKQTELENIGSQGQEKLRAAKVLVVGAGGLGCAVLPYLAGAGVGTIGIIDGDRIEVANLHRQILYKEAEIFSSKAKKAGEFIKEANSEINVMAYDEYLDKENATSIFSNYEIIVDATDNISIRMLINDVAELLKIPVVYASVYKYEGQVSVFNFQNGPTYRCVFGEQEHSIPNCSDSGVLGTTVGIIGLLQANEVLKIILNSGEVLSGRLLMYNTLTNEQNIFKFEKQAASPSQAENHELNLEVSKEEAFSSPNHLVVDIREPFERPLISSQNVQKVPLSKLDYFLSSVDKTEMIYLICQKGARSFAAVKKYRNKGFQNIKSVKGGIQSYKEKLVYE